MTTIAIQRSVSMGHRLPSYKGLCSSPHGHNMRVAVEVIVPLGKFLDFKVVDKTLEEVLEPFDHAMCLQSDDLLLPTLMQFGFRVVEFPVEPTTEALAAYFADRMCERGINVARITVYETDKYSATVVL